MSRVVFLMLHAKAPPPLSHSLSGFLFHAGWYGVAGGFSWWPCLRGADGSWAFQWDGLWSVPQRHRGETQSQCKQVSQSKGYSSRILPLNILTPRSSAVWQIRICQLMAILHGQVAVSMWWRGTDIILYARFYTLFYVSVCQILWDWYQDALNQRVIPVPRFDVLLDVSLTIHLIPSPHDTFISG